MIDVQMRLVIQLKSCDCRNDVVGIIIYMFIIIHFTVFEH